MELRLRSVRYKNGGYVRLLPAVRENVSAALEAKANEMIQTIWSAEWHKGKVAGYALVAWTADGDLASDVQASETSPLAPSVIPAVAADAIRRILTKTQINRVLGLPDDAS